MLLLVIHFLQLKNSSEVSHNSPTLQVLLSNRCEVDSLQKPNQDAVALVELCEALFADKL